MKGTSKVLFKTVVVLICVVITFYDPVTAISHQDIPTGEEYMSGTITNEHFNLNYVWVNTNETSFLSLTMYDEFSGMSPIAPFYPFFGQSFNVNNNPFFVGTVITGFELYQDSNDNGVLDLGEELKYYVGLNASQGILLPQIEKTTTDTKRIYKWKVGYSEIDGFLFPDPDLYINRKAIIDNVNLTYTFEISGNYSELKLAIEMGAWDAYEYTFNDQTPPEELRLQDIDLTNYSLSILFGTTVSSEQPISIDVTDATEGISDVMIKVNDIPIFQSLFQDTYDLGLSGTTYSAKAIPAALDTLYDDQVLSWRTPQELYIWWDSFFSSMSNLATIPELDIENVNFLYRICYPIWNGEPFNHDPRYRALFEGRILPPDSSTSEPSSSSEPGSFPTNAAETSSRSTAETTSKDQITPFFLIPEVFMLLILVPFLRKKRNV